MTGNRVHDNARQSTEPFAYWIYAASDFIHVSSFASAPKQRINEGFETMEIESISFTPQDVFEKIN